MIKESWKDLKEYEGLYKISNWGRIKTFNWKNTGREALLKPAMDNKGYLRYSLQKDGKRSTHKAHRLVAQNFLDNPKSKPQVNHKNGIKYENNTENLEWATQSENIKHAYSNLGKKPQRGETNGLSKLNEQQVLEIRSKFKKRIYTREMLGKEYGVAPSTIKDIVLRKSWKHI